MEIMRTITNKEAVAVVEDITYNISYVLVDNTINSVSSTVTSTANDLSTNMNNQLGYIRKENGRIYADFEESEDPTLHLIQFMKFVKEIEAEVATEIQ